MSGTLHLRMANTSKGNKAPWSPYALIAILLIALLLVKNYLKNPTGPSQNDTHKVVVNNNNNVPNNDNGLIRNPASIHYSKHARCRMECRHIDESEVKEILTNGTINYNKSELQGEVCRKRYAVEGTTHDNQRVRLIFAPCGNEETVVTVIDLGKEWSCDCK